MELKTNYQYTYFIHPFVIKEHKYIKYMLKMLKDDKCELKVFKKERDFGVYKYFTPKTRDILFSTFSFTQEKVKKFNEMPLDTRAAMLAKYPCAIFEYNIKSDIQGKTDVNNGIFFKIQKCEIICFNTGICFLAIKTNVEDSQNLTDILNFNYKFRDISEENVNLSNYDNIRIQTDSFSSVDKLTDFIHNITGSSLETMKLDIDAERFNTYSYVCIDQKDWNQNQEFDKIKSSFYKFSNILPADTSFQFNDNDVENSNIQTVSKWKYAKIGITKKAITLFTSSTDINNFCMLPTDFENQYLYTYILTLYKKLYLKKLSNDFSNNMNNRKTRKKFIDFTKNIWLQEVSEDETGTFLEHKIKDVLEIDKLYLKVKNEYDILFKELKIEKNSKVTLMIAILLIGSLIFNVLNYIALIN